MATQLFDEDGVRLAQQVGVVLAHFAEDTHAESRTRERMAVHHLARQAELDTEPSHFVFEQLAQRFHQLHAHVRRQSAHVVVRLDDVRLAGLAARGFDDVGVDSALGQPVHFRELRGFFVEHFHEQPTDDLALLFRVGFAAQRVEEARFGIDTDDLHTQVVGEDLHDLVAFVEAHEAVIDEHAGQLVANGLVQQRGDHRGIDAAGQAEQHLALAHLRTHARDGVVDDVADAPQRLASANLAHEALEQLLALQRVRDFGVELHGVEAARFVDHGRQRRVGAGGDRRESRRQRLDAIAVTHPHVEDSRGLARRGDRTARRTAC